MEIQLPQNKWSFIAATNFAWWLLPFGIAFEMSRNISSYAPDPMADSLGIVIIPLFAIWFILWIGLNFILFIKAKSYPAGASIFVWKAGSKYSLLFWTILCTLFVATYIVTIFLQLQFDLENHIFSLGIYIPLLVYILFSFFIRRLMIEKKVR